MRRRAPIRLVQRLHSVFASAHRVGVVRERHHGAPVPRKLLDEADLDSLGLQRAERVKGPAKHQWRRGVVLRDAKLTTAPPPGRCHLVRTHVARPGP